MLKPSLKAAVERIGGKGERYLGADGCADRYGFSKRHWSRLVDSGRAPQPTHFGRLVRWSLESLSEWEAGGCKPIRSAKKSVRAVEISLWMLALVLSDPLCQEVGAGMTNNDNGCINADCREAMRQGRTLDDLARLASK